MSQISPNWKAVLAGTVGRLGPAVRNHRLRRLAWIGLLVLPLLSACGGSNSSSGTGGSNWDQMKWDQGKWA